jgi:hypothetical protein
MAKRSLLLKHLLIFCSIVIGIAIIWGGIVSANTNQSGKNLFVKKTFQPFIQKILNKSIQEDINQSRKGNKKGAISSCNSILISTKLDSLGDSNNVKAIVKEKRSCAYKIGGPLEEGIYTHIFEFHKNKEGKWILRKFEDGSKFKIHSPTNEEKKLPLVPSPEKVIKERKGTAPFDEIKTYNRDSAAWYGWYYALTPNPDFRYFEEDCTNFISQAVWYGNWPWVGWWPNKYSTSVWWYSFYDWQGQSWTWTSAQYWWWFTHDRPRGYLTDNFCNLQKGDIVQADWNQDGHVDHSMIVTYKDGCDVRVSYHTNNTRNRSIWDIYSSYPNAWYYPWRLYDYGD